MQSIGPLPDNAIWHLIHSSFLLKLQGIVMVFDYFEEPAAASAQGGLDAGVIDGQRLTDEEVYVFASHSHRDHFHPLIFDWKKGVSNIHYVLSYDIPRPPAEAAVLKPGEKKSVGRIQVQAYPSSDAGLAYSIYAQGKHVYYSGDNAFWNWDNDLGDEIYERIALDAIDRKTPMDIAFQVCDPRLDGMGDGGICVFARQFQPRLLVPIHSFGRYEFNAVVEKRLRDSGFANAYWCVSKRGEMYSIPR
jgi:L-ascorbate metabolism protein UlaG (beta-lactamase superfamily)